MKTQNLIRTYEQSVNALVKAFCQKQYVKFDVDMWADRVGGVILIRDYYYLNFSDIYYDMETEQPKGMIFDWYNYLEHNKDKSFVNYESYIKGFRHEPQL